VDIRHWTAFTAATTLFVAAPGPFVVLVVSRALGSGTRAAMRIAFGEVAANAILWSCALAGLSTVLASAPSLFRAIYVIGGGYRLYLGGSMFLPAAGRAPSSSNAGTHTTDPARAVSSKSALRDGFLLGLKNPKDIVFLGVRSPSPSPPSRPRLS